MHNFASILDSIAKGTSYFHNFLHSAALHHLLHLFHTFCKLIRATCIERSDINAAPVLHNRCVRAIPIRRESID